MFDLFLSLVEFLKLTLHFTRPHMAWHGQPNGVMLIPHINFRANIGRLGTTICSSEKKELLNRIRTKGHTHRNTHLFFAQLLYCIRAKNNFRCEKYGKCSTMYVKRERQVDSILFKQFYPHTQQNVCTRFIYNRNSRNSCSSPFFTGLHVSISMAYIYTLPPLAFCTTIWQSLSCSLSVSVPVPE